jgi:hypothetical protein
MDKQYIKYKCGYKYQIDEEYQVKVSILPEKDVPTDNAARSFLELKTDGTLIIKRGYAWDGPSGPAIDTLNFMRGSLVHDALYQLLRNGDIKQEFRKKADEELRKICREDGMSKIRSNWVYWAVHTFAKKAASQETRKEVITAPK